MLPEGTRAVIDAARWTLPPVFAWLARAGGVEAAEMLRVFNCGLGMVLVVSDPAAARAVLEAEGETVFDIGHVEAHAGEPDVRIDLPEGWPG